MIPHSLLWVGNLFVFIVNRPGQKKRVLVALSGGVDSAMAAVVLKKQGYEIIGVFFYLGDWVQKGLKNAEKITAKLNIPLKTVDVRKEFRKKIVDYFRETYKKGQTPNPCVMCNKEIKFQLLFDLIRKYKADYVATGHYARIGREISSSKPQIPNKTELKITNYKLLVAKDKLKDQSYFLYRLTQKDLARIIFPLGDYKKVEVKRIVKKMGLPVTREESQDICFLQGGRIDFFLGSYLELKPGNIVDEKGNILGKHKGLPLYTIGQRRGIEIGGTGPYFVIRKDAQKNELVVTDDPKKLLTKKFLVSQVNWINKEVKLPLRAQLQIRYRAPKFSAIIRRSGGKKLEVIGEKYWRAVTPGQSAVFYKKGEVLGGGIII